MRDDKYAFSVDLEDFFQVSAFNDVITRDDWKAFSPRVELSVERLRTLLNRHNVKATFFCLGWIAEHFPTLIQKLAEDGHEIASHGYHHQRVYSLTPEQFAEDIGRTKQLLEQLTGQEVLGYRAPSFSIRADCDWAYDELLKAGYRYSSSVYPIDHDHYGSSSLPRSPFYPRQGLLEVPISTLRLFRRNWPVGGGGWFRLYPYQLSRWMMHKRAQQDDSAMVFYIHPWELDPEQPKISGIPWRTEFRHYLNLSRVESRLDKLLQDFTWSSLLDVYGGAIQEKDLAA